MYKGGEMFERIKTGLIIFGVIVFAILVVLFGFAYAYCEIVIFVLLLWYKKFLIAMAFAVGLILFKTIRNYNVDVFHDDCENFVCHNV
jgi:hypothetical protein